MVWQISIDLAPSCSVGAEVTAQLAALGWFTVSEQAGGSRLVAEPQARWDVEAGLIERTIAVVCDNFPYAVAINNGAVAQHGFATIRHWLAAHCAGDYLVLAYGEDDADGRQVFCFRHADHAFRFGIAF